MWKGWIFIIFKIWEISSKMKITKVVEWWKHFCYGLIFWNGYYFCLIFYPSVGYVMFNETTLFVNILDALVCYINFNNKKKYNFKLMVFKYKYFER